MQQKLVDISAIDNGYVVTIYGTGSAPNTGTTTQYCATKNAIAAYLVQQLVPGATYTASTTTTD